MSRLDCDYSDLTSVGCWCTPCANPYSCGCAGSAGAFSSDYLEAVGSTQSVATNANVAFDFDPESIDIAGSAITLDPVSGTVFTITRPGLYLVEWSLNLAPGNPAPLTVGLMENGNPSSALANSATVGNFSSGALLNITKEDLPFTLSLHNFGPPLSLTDAVGAVVFQNTAASIRILRFATGAR